MKEYVTKAQQKAFYNTAAWRGVNGIRRQALKRDNNECQVCKQQGYVHVDSIKTHGERKTIELNVHHIKEIEIRPDLALSLDNVITICLRHHNEVHDRYKPSSNKFARDERW